MTQQINLFDARFRKQKRQFSAATLVLALASLLVLAIALQWLLALQNRSLQATLAGTDQRVMALRDQLVRLSADFSAQGRSNALGDEIARVEEQLRARRELLAGMRYGGGDVEGFSPYLSALGRQTMDGLWLTSVAIGGKSGELVLKGRVLDSGLVPAYLGRLSKEEPFAGRTVSELRMAASQGAARHVEFSLSMPLREPEERRPARKDAS